MTYRSMAVQAVNGEAETGKEGSRENFFRAHSVHHSHIGANSV